MEFIYKTLAFLVIIVVIIVIVIVSSVKKEVNTASKAPGKPQAPLKREIKRYNVIGMKYQSRRDIPDGDFVGLAKATWHEKDKNCIEISVNNRCVGYLPRGNYRLHNAIKEWHNGAVPVWGFIYYNEDRKDWNGHVNIPLGLDEKEYENFIK